jgi:hypothetical protein
MHPLVETGKQGSAVLRCVRSGRGHFLSSASSVQKVSVERGICSALTSLTSNLPLVYMHLKTLPTLMCITYIKAQTKTKLNSVALVRERL